MPQVKVGDLETLGLVQQLDGGGHVAFRLAYSGSDDPPAVGILRQPGGLTEVAAALIMWCARVMFPGSSASVSVRT